MRVLTGHSEWTVYGASKTEAERAIWKFVKEEKPDLVVNSINPNCNLGQILSDKQPASTANIPRTIFMGNLEFSAQFPPRESLPRQKPEMGSTDFCTEWFIDVQDVARLHVAGLLNPDLENERILGFAEKFNVSRILGTFRKMYPDRVFPGDPVNDDKDLSTVPNEKGRELLKAFGQEGYTTFEESLKKNVAGMV